MNRNLPNMPLSVDPNSTDQPNINRQLAEAIRQLWLRSNTIDKSVESAEKRIKMLEIASLPDNLAYIDRDNGFTAKQTLPGARMGNYVGGNYSEIESDGTLRFEGEATVWDDLNVSVQSLGTVGATILDVVTVGSNNFRAFIGTGVQVQQADGSMEILHDYKEGSDIVPHLHWMPEDTNAGNVKISLGYRWWNHGEVMPAETIVSFTQAAGGVAYKPYRTDFATLSGTGKSISSRFVFRLFRDPADVADTYAHYAIPLDFGIHYKKDTIGSRSITTK